MVSLYERVNAALLIDCNLANLSLNAWQPLTEWQRSLAPLGADM